MTTLSVGQTSVCRPNGGGAPLRLTNAQSSVGPRRTIQPLISTLVHSRHPRPSLARESPIAGHSYPHSHTHEIRFAVPATTSVGFSAKSSQ